MNDSGMDHQGDLEIIVGTYEDYVVGYQVETMLAKKIDKETPQRKKLKNGNGDADLSASKKKETKQMNGSATKLDLEQSFAVRGHSGSVRCLTASSDGNLVFSAGYDEMMNLFNLKRRKLLQTSEGAINCANFVGTSHLICGADDGNIYIYECKAQSMILAKTLKGHKAGVTSIDTHPSGKILLSISKDHTMRTWNLIKGRCAYVTQIKAESQLIKWSQTGEEFLIAANNEIYLYNNLGGLKQCFKLDKRVNSIEFITEDIFAVAIDSGKLEFFDISKDECSPVIKIEAHETRIKSVKCLTDPETSPTDGDDASNNDSSKKAPTKKIDIRFATAASDGSVKIWSVTRLRDTLKDPKELATVDIGARVTCMIVSTRKMSE